MREQILCLSALYWCVGAGLKHQHKACQFYVKFLNGNSDSLRVPQLNGLEFVNCPLVSKVEDRVSIFQPHALAA